MKDGKLDVSNLNILSLPELPKTLKYLNTLPELPETLTKLYCADTRTPEMD